MNHDSEKLEKVLHETLRRLPPRAAPSGLEARVLAEIARREALPWWYRSWSHWPAVVRWVFLAVSAGVCAATIIGGVALLRGSSLGMVGRVLAESTQIWNALGTASRTTLHIGEELFGLIPHLWLYGGVATITLLYATVFLVGAAAYRTLWQSR